VSEAYEYATNICKLKESGQGLVTNADQSEALIYFHKLATSMSGNVQPSQGLEENLSNLLEKSKEVGRFLTCGNRLKLLIGLNL
jgi:hypothetical protein